MLADVTDAPYYSSCMMRELSTGASQGRLFGIVTPTTSECQTTQREKMHLLQEHIQADLNKNTRHPIVMLHNFLHNRKRLFAYLPIIITIISMFCGISWQIFLPKTDPARYQCYALTFWLGSNATHLLPPAQCDFFHDFLHLSSPIPPFHMLPLEYPPLTLIPFSLALLAPLPYYQLAFGLFMSLIAVLIYGLLLHFGPKGGALLFAIYLFIGAIAVAQQRFDLIPALLTLLCLIAAERKHWTAAYIALAFGVLFKLYPILLLPALFIAEQQNRGTLTIPEANFTRMELLPALWNMLRSIRKWHWNNCLLCLLIIVVVTGAFALLDFQGAVVNQVVYFLHRPIQVEATGSTLLRVAEHIGIPFTISSTYGSLNINSILDGPVGMISTLCLIVGFLAVIWQQWRGRLDLAQSMIALLLVFVATGKVFSPQYLIWLMPLLAYVGAFDLFWLVCWGIISLLTTYIYAVLYTRPVASLTDIPYTPGFVQLVTLRNAFFVLVTLAYLFNWFQVRQRKTLPSRPIA